MELLGLDVRADSVIGVVVDGGGAVLRRARRYGEVSKAVPAASADLWKGTPYGAAGVSSELDPGELDWLGGGSMARGVSVLRSSPGAAVVSAETWVGAARGARHAVCLWIGDRVFAGTLLNGQPWMGAHGLAGAAAWLALNPVERQDYRKYGSLAAEVSNSGIARRLAWRIQAGDQSAVLERAGDLDAITATHVFEAARAGDGVAISVVRDTARYVGMAIANLVTAIDPEVTVLGGAIATAADLLFDPVKQECLRRLPPALASHLRFEFSTLAEDGIAIGAASVARAARQS
jgi:glucokinase